MSNLKYWHVEHAVEINVLTATNLFGQESLLQDSPINKRCNKHENTCSQRPGPFWTVTENEWR